MPCCPVSVPLVSNEHLIFMRGATLMISSRVWLRGVVSTCSVLLSMVSFLIGPLLLQLVPIAEEIRTTGETTMEPQRSRIVSVVSTRTPSG